MKHGHMVSFRQVESAASHVQRELGALGLWNEGSRLIDVDVVWCRVPHFQALDALGYYVSEAGAFARAFGFDVGHIYVPQFVPLQGFNQQRGSLREILRHEYGHALAYRYPRLISRARVCREVFGAGHDDDHDGGMWEEHGDSAYVSDYAQSCPREDFAETFAWWVRHRGKRPAHLRHPVVRRKWKFVGEVAQAVASGQRRW